MHNKGDWEQVSAGGIGLRLIIVIATTGLDGTERSTVLAGVPLALSNCGLCSIIVAAATGLDGTERSDVEYNLIDDPLLPPS